MTSWMHTNTLANTKTPHVCGTNIPPRNTSSICFWGPEVLTPRPVSQLGSAYDKKEAKAKGVAVHSTWRHVFLFFASALGFKLQTAKMLKTSQANLKKEQYFFNAWKKSVVNDTYQTEISIYYKSLFVRKPLSSVDSYLFSSFNK